MKYLCVSITSQYAELEAVMPRDYVQTKLFIETALNPHSNDESLLYYLVYFSWMKCATEDYKLPTSYFGAR